ncbi:Integrase/recombinase, N-terminal [Phytophthora cactorum]|nr:Integrase/recombinase, N-terminal [Phytophthora cactorum]
MPRQRISPRLHKRLLEAVGLSTRHLNLQLDEQIRTISDFIIDARERGFGSNRPIQSSTIKSALHGIRHFLNAAGFDFPSGHPQVCMLLRGVSRYDAPSQQKAPVSAALLGSHRLGDDPSPHTGSVSVHTIVNQRYYPRNALTSKMVAADRRRLRPDTLCVELSIIGSTRRSRLPCKVCFIMITST